MTNIVADAFVPELVSASIDRTLEANLVAQQICRRKPKLRGNEGPGDIIHFPALADPTVNTTYAGTATYENLVSSEVSMLLDKTYYTAFNVSDLDEFMSVVGLKDSQDQRAGYKLQESIDTAIMALYTQANLSVTADTTCDSSTITSDIAEVGVSIKNAHIRDGNAFMVIPPWVEAKLNLAGVRFEYKNGTNVQNGIGWAKVNGIDLYVTTQVTNTNTASAPVSQCMYGSYDAICFHKLLSKSYAMRESADPLTNKVSNFVFWGMKVVRPDLLGNIALTYTAESSTL